MGRGYKHKKPLLDDPIYQNLGDLGLAYRAREELAESLDSEEVAMYAGVRAQLVGVMQIAKAMGVSRKNMAKATGISLSELPKTKEV